MKLSKSKKDKILFQILEYSIFGLAVFNSTNEQFKISEISRKKFVENLFLQLLSVLKIVHPYFISPRGLKQVFSFSNLRNETMLQFLSELSVHPFSSQHGCTNKFRRNHLKYIFDLETNSWLFQFLWWRSYWEGQLDCHTSCFETFLNIHISISHIVSLPIIG